LWFSKLKSNGPYLILLGYKARETLEKKCMENRRVINSTVNKNYWKVTNEIQKENKREGNFLGFS